MLHENTIPVKNLSVNGYGARRLLSEFPDKGWKLGSMHRQFAEENARRVCLQLHGNQAAADRVRCI